jgi:hypothetical protein
MKYGKLLSINEIKNIYRIKIEVELNVMPGQFISLVFPKIEIPLSIGDYRNKILELNISSKKITDLLSQRQEVIIKGPIGKPIELYGKILGIAEGELYYDILFPLREAKRKGLDVAVKCNECNSEFRNPKPDEKWDIILASVKNIKTLPTNALIYTRWTKMNCMLGVCGICEVNGHLPCIEGPFLEVSKIVD